MIAEFGQLSLALAAGLALASAAAGLLAHGQGMQLLRQSTVSMVESFLHNRSGNLFLQQS